MSLQSPIAVEIAVQDVEGVRIAIREGAQRVELCQALGTGGLTPSIGLVMAAVRAADEAGLSDFVHVLVRPREGGFVYSPAEIDVMSGDILALEAAGAAGIVVGALRSDRTIDLEALAQLRQAAGSLAVTFHRAVDATTDPVRSADQLRDAGVDRLLTSGGARASIDGAEKLAQMASRGDSSMQIMAGGGVTIDAIPVLARAGVDAVHLSARRRAGRVTETGPGGGSPSYDITDATTVARAVAAARRAAVAV
ncbi:copper homeostasis protein CutC [Plantibacter sp. PA-3-X8]|uniref:copper homeostasis protein CutC n=1 Tax=Plantibacter sp. PA-3-X8 TaxID=2480625 RepID=UPI000F6023C5|nr:copper homeostasis protein CutC [Plantibacter sp. PA-3-X8]AZH83479.1 copper homeostasis protein CutC [Plantibacter sp. PA-3-X8]